MLRPTMRCVIMATSLVLAAAPLSCSGIADYDGQLEDTGGTDLGVVSIPPKGAPGTLDVGEWNIEWFGSTGFGPTNEALQLENVRDVIQGTDLDIWAIEEVVSATHWNNLKSQLPGYAGLLANDPTVAQGSSYYTASEQKVGILYKTSVASVQSAKLILTDQDYNFGGRPPLEVKLNVTAFGAPTSLVFIVFHAKALADAESYNRRKNASTALKSYLDSAHPNERVIVAADFNDDLDLSIAGGGKLSPYKNFVDDAADYFFPTKDFTDANQSTTVNSSTPIDHHMVTNELTPLYIAGSAEVYEVDAYVPQYDDTTTDHYPTLTRYALGGAPKLILNEICANEPGASTAGELVEIVNVGSGTADLSGYTLSDATGLRHTFPNGASLAAGKAIVVFGGAAGIPAGLTNAVAASSGGLSLANSGDTVTLKDNTSVVVDSFIYTAPLAANDGVSMNRSPDMSADGVFVLHTTLVAAPSSPGKKANGANF
jgi:endonuclease/exonuclease/phosphatase family metal-dependent hydrolase